MPIDPAVQGFLDQMGAAEGPAIEELTPEEARTAFLPLIDLQGPPEELPGVEDAVAPGPDGPIPLRIYRASLEPAQPALVFFHGGGWVVGSIDFYDAVCRRLAKLAGCTIVSVEYRLAPEHRYPAAAEDAYAATRWVHQEATTLNIDPARLAVGGDSAGGNLTAVVALMARDRSGPPLVAQVLHCPVIDAGLDTSSYAANAEGYLLTRAGMIWFWDHYVPEVQRRSEPYASPLRAEDLGGLPPALVQVAELDPLRDEGVAYAERLRDAGVPTTFSESKGMIHDPWTFAGVFEGSRVAQQEAADFLRAAFGAAQS